MKRLYIHVGVERLDEAIRFYKRLLGGEPVFLAKPGSNTLVQKSGSCCN